jgi:hypothetical protein
MGSRGNRNRIFDLGREMGESRGIQENEFGSSVIM